MADQKVKINSGTSLSAFLSSVIEEGVKSALAQKALTEKEKQDTTSNSLDSLFGGDSSEGGDENDSGSDDAGDQVSSKTMDDETEKLQKGEIQAKDVVEKLNSIRGGKSFKDEHVSKAMEEYVDSLAKAEKVALLAFLNGIAQIVTGTVQGNQAEEPSEHPADVKMQKGDGPEKIRHLDPNVIKSGPKPKHATHSAEDTSAPAPITPKRR